MKCFSKTGLISACSTTKSRNDKTTGLVVAVREWRFSAEKDGEPLAKVFEREFVTLEGFDVGFFGAENEFFVGSGGVIRAIGSVLGSHLGGLLRRRASAGDDNSDRFVGIELAD